MSRRTAVASLILLGWLGSLTYHNESFWASDPLVWSRNEQTVRAHVNARQAALDTGNTWAALEECHWLLTAAEQGQPVNPTAQQTRDIRRVCLRVAASSQP